MLVFILMIELIEINKSQIAKNVDMIKFQMISINEAKERMETENFVIRLKCQKLAKK